MFYFVANHVVLRIVNYNTFLTRACQVILPLLQRKPRTKQLMVDGWLINCRRNVALSDAEGGTHKQLDPKFIWKVARKQAVLHTGVLITTISFCTLIGALPLIHEVFSPQTKHVRASLHLWSLNCKYLEFSSMAHYLYGKLKLYTMRILLFVLVK